MCHTNSADIRRVHFPYHHVKHQTNGQGDFLTLIASITHSNTETSEILIMHVNDTQALFDSNIFIGIVMRSPSNYAKTGGDISQLQWR